MRAVTYGRGGTLTEADRDRPTPQPGEVLVRVAVSGVNPADWKNRRNYTGDGVVVPNHDGAGIVEAVGAGVDPARAGQRVWLWETGRQRCGGTAQEFTVVPDQHAVELPAQAGLAVGACLGVPAITAHRCLTVVDGGPSRLGPGALDGRVVLVAGGAGAVGHAAIQLARWSDATVVATVSSAEKEELARSAGAHHVVRYDRPGAAAAVRAAAGGGVDIVVEVAPDQNVELDMAVLAPSGTVAAYAGRPGLRVILDAGASLAVNARWQFVQAFTIPQAAKLAAVHAVSAGLADGALPVGADAGLPLHRFDLAGTGRAHDQVQHGITGKALITVDPALQ
jgi:NADPH2:quinone reductase